MSRSVKRVIKRSFHLLMYGASWGAFVFFFLWGTVLFNEPFSTMTFGPDMYFSWWFIINYAGNLLGVIGASFLGRWIQGYLLLPVGHQSLSVQCKEGITLGLILGVAAMLWLPISSILNIPLYYLEEFKACVIFISVTTFSLIVISYSPYLIIEPSDVLEKIKPATEKELNPMGKTSTVAVGAGIPLWLIFNILIGVEQNTLILGSIFGLTILGHLIYLVLKPKSFLKALCRETQELINSSLDKAKQKENQLQQEI